MMKLGNPLLDDHYDNKGSFEYWWNHGLISDSTQQQLNKWCQNASFLFPKGSCSDALVRAYTQFGDINPYDVYGDVCADLGTSALLRHHLTKPLVRAFSIYQLISIFVEICIFIINSFVYSRTNIGEMTSV